MSMFNQQSKKYSKPQAGFTLIELMVSLSIVVIILGIVLINYKGFDSTVVLNNLAYDIGLSIREAQSYGISVKGQVSSGDQVYTYPYGIHFDTANPTQYTVFVDLNGPDSKGKFGNGYYDSGNASEKVKTYTIKPGFMIKSICTLHASTEDCSDTDSNLTALDVSFVRPDPDATIYKKYAGTEVPTTDAAEIKVNSSQSPSTVRTIIIRSTGQISVQ